MKPIILTGPVLFAGVLAALTLVKYEFLLSLGWHPIHDPTFDWPSGLALGEFGWIMTLTFILTGSIMTLFARRLYLDLEPTPASKLGATLTAFAGLFLAALAFTTDPTIRDYPATWHGRLHDLSFVLLGLTLFPAMVVLGFAFRADDRWKNFAFYTWGTLALAGPAFFIKGAAFYIFLLAILVWNELAAMRISGKTTPAS
ncbi:MAG: DUF998 domain-containing protein [Anaerolineales bacterium]|jgi:hypothetical protein|nr:DUF998 domain-containing protein [Chloroflexota bacterium]MBK6646322.1 DUF998 domain-containing protein [Anaerolineales bacterium]MCC6986259.1 DUF998 domain-containing protein [Anaerolineales bacterium]